MRLVRRTDDLVRRVHRGHPHRITREFDAQHMAGLGIQGQDLRRATPLAQDRLWYRGEDGALVQERGDDVIERGPGQTAQGPQPAPSQRTVLA